MKSVWNEVYHEHHIGIQVDFNGRSHQRERTVSGKYRLEYLGLVFAKPVLVVLEVAYLEGRQSRQAILNAIGVQRIREENPFWDFEDFEFAVTQLPGRSADDGELEKLRWRDDALSD